MKDLIAKFESVNAIVLGDAINDVYTFGRVERVSPEAPVPVFIPESEEKREGGAAHVLVQMRAFGAKVVGCYGSPFSTKYRFMVGHQMVGLRVDDDCQCTIGSKPAVEIFDEMIKSINMPIHVFVLSDYAKGFLSPELCQAVIKFATANKLPVVVDPKGSDWSKYAGATLICPNDKEFGNTWHGIAVLHKRGSKGVCLYEPPYRQILDGIEAPTQDFFEYAAKARHVYDVTGAGDTVVALAALVLGAGGTLRQAAELGNLAAGVCVEKIGTSICTKEELLCLVA